LLPIDPAALADVLTLSLHDALPIWAPAKPVPDVDLAKLAEPYISAENGITTAEAALEGALLILADRITHDPQTRARFREELRRRSEEHTSELQSRENLVCRLLLEKK